MKNTVMNFIEFISKYKFPLIFSFLFSFVCYANMLMNYTLSIDEDHWISGSNVPISFWLKQGRFGLYIFDRIFVPSGSFIPVLWDILAVICWFISAVIFTFGITIMSDKVTKLSVFAFCGVFVSIPFVLSDWMSFSMFNFQQGLAMIIMALGVLCTILYFKNRQKYFFILSAILVLISTSFYQAHIIVYISAVAIILFLLVIDMDNPDIKLLLKDLLRAILVFFTAFAAYYFIDLYIRKCITYQDFTYGTFLFSWNQHSSIAAAIKYLMAELYNALTGRNYIGGSVHMLLLCVFLTVLTVLLARAKQLKKRILLILTGCFMMISPFILQIVFGSFGVSGRIVLALPLILAFILFLGVNLASKHSFMKLLSSFIVMFVLASNAFTMNELYYDSFLRYQSDKQIASQVISSLDQGGYDRTSKPIVFIGKIDIPVRGDSSHPALGSFWWWDDGNNYRMIWFLQAEQYNVLLSNAEQRTLGAEMAEDMPCWPEPGSMIETEDIIVVKLSDPSELWYTVNV